MFPIKPVLLIALLCALGATVSGCGQTGPLVMPDDSATAPASQPGTSAQTNE